MFLIRQKTKFHIDFFIFDAITILIEYNCLSFFNKSTIVGYFRINSSQKNTKFVLAIAYILSYDKYNYFVKTHQIHNNSISYMDIMAFLLYYPLKMKAQHIIAIIY